MLGIDIGKMTRADDDKWRLGITLFTMLTGVTPFNQDRTEDDRTEKLAYHNMNEEQQLDWLFSKHREVPEGAKKAIRGLLQTDPSKRLKPADALRLWNGEGLARGLELKPQGAAPRLKPHSRAAQNWKCW